MVTPGKVRQGAVVLALAALVVVPRIRPAAAQASRNVQLVGRFTAPETVAAVTVAGTRAYVGGARFGLGTRGARELYVVDVSDPTQPRQLGKTGLLPGPITGIAAVGDHVYLAAGEAGLRVVDVTDPAQPVEVGAYDTPGHAWRVAVAGAYAYVADNDSLRVVGVADPAHPTEVASLAIASQDVKLRGRYAYVAVGSVAVGSALALVDVADPGRPTVVSTLGTPGYGRAVALSGDHALLAAGSAGGLRAIDVSRPSQPVEVGAYDTPGSASDVAVLGDHAFVADGDAGVRVVDVLDPSRPRELGFHDAALATQVAVGAAEVYVAAQVDALLIVRYVQPAFVPIYLPVVPRNAGLATAPATSVPRPEP